MAAWGATKLMQTTPTAVMRYAQSSHASCIVGDGESLTRESVSSH
jgi:hypothetical protein